MSDTMNESFVVVGAGVLGLSTATLLQESRPKASITIIAAELPTPSPIHQTSSETAQTPSADYASMWAGAHYRPIPHSQSNEQMKDEFRMASATLRRMKQIAAQDAHTSGVAIVPAAEYLENPPTEYTVLRTGDIYTGAEDDFRVLTQPELDIVNNSQAGSNKGIIKWGCEYTSYVVNVHVYCGWLLKNFLEKGGKVIQRRLAKISDAFDVLPKQRQPPVVINCSGRNFDTDPLIKIIRGQTVLVRQEYHRTVTRQNSDGSWSFLIPRPLGGGTIVGGTKEVDDPITTPRIETRLKLLQSAANYFPDFIKDARSFDVICDNVGRRPWRKGGLRIEREQLGQGRVVIHGYGAGGSGYELSWGAAERIFELVNRGQRLEAKL